MNSIFAETLFGEDLYEISGKVLIIIPKSWDGVSQDEKGQLSKILGAIKLNIESVQIITLQVITPEFMQRFLPAYVISFGVPFHPEIKPYEVALTDNIKIIYADGLDRLDDLRKRNLWMALKTMFGV